MTHEPAPTAVADQRRDARLARRLLHRTRSIWVSIALILAMALAILVIVETLLWGRDLPPALVAPDAVRAAMTEGGFFGGVVAGIALVLGLACLWGALAPGGTHRRIVTTERAPIVVDDAILAGGLSRTCAHAAGVSATQVTTRVTRHRALIAVTPSSGFAVDASEVERAAGELLEVLGAGTHMKTRVELARKGNLS